MLDLLTDILFAGSIFTAVIYLFTIENFLAIV